MNLKEKLNSITLNEDRASFPIQLLQELAKSEAIEKTIKITQLPDGVAGLFRTPDGQAYEIQIRPAKYGQLKHLNPGS